MCLPRGWSERGAVVGQNPLAPGSSQLLSGRSNYLQLLEASRVLLYVRARVDIEHVKTGRL